INGGQLEMTLRYSGRQFNTTTVHSFMECYKENLLQVINYCCSYGRVELTPSDVTYKELSIAQLDALQGNYDIEDVYPLSPMQEGLLFHALLDVDSGSYFGQTICEIKGYLDIPAVEKSMNDLMARYDILRGIYLHEGFERRIQVVLKERK